MNVDAAAADLTLRSGDAEFCNFVSESVKIENKFCDLTLSGIIKGNCSQCAVWAMLTLPYTVTNLIIILMFSKAMLVLIIQKILKIKTENIILKQIAVWEKLILLLNKNNLFFKKNKNHKKIYYFFKQLLTKINFYGLILYRGDIVKIQENLKRGMTELLILHLLK